MLKRNVEKVLEFVLAMLTLPLVMLNDFEISALPLIIAWVIAIVVLLSILVRYGKDFK